MLVFASIVCYAVQERITAQDRPTLGPPAPVPPPAPLPVAPVRNKRVICTYTDYTSKYRLYQLEPRTPANTDNTGIYKKYKRIQAILANTDNTSEYR